MKRRGYLVIILLIVLMFSSCGMAKKVVRKVLEDEIAEAKKEKKANDKKKEKKTETKKKKDKTKKTTEAEEVEEDFDYKRNYTYEDSVSKMVIIEENDIKQTRLVDLEGNVIDDYSYGYYEYIDNTSFIMIHAEDGYNYIFDMTTGEKMGPYDLIMSPECYSKASNSDDVTVYLEEDLYGIIKNGKKITDAKYMMIDYILDGYFECMNLDDNSYVILDEDGKEFMKKENQEINNMGYGFFSVGFLPRIYLGNELLIDKTFIDAIALDENTIFAIDETGAYFFDREGNLLNGKYTTANYHICNNVINSMGNIVLANYDYTYANKYTVLNKYGELISEPYTDTKKEITLENGDSCKVKSYQPSALHTSSYVEFESETPNKYKEANELLFANVEYYHGMNHHEVTDELKGYIEGETSIDVYNGVIGIRSTTLISAFPEGIYYDGLVPVAQIDNNFYVNTESGDIYSLEDLLVDIYDGMDYMERLARQKMEEEYYLSAEEAKDYHIFDDYSFSIDPIENIIYIKMASTEDDFSYVTGVSVGLGMDELSPYLDTTNDLFDIIN